MKLILGLVVIALPSLWLAFRSDDTQMQAETAAARPRPALLLDVSYLDGPKDWGEILGIGLARELAGTDFEVLRDSCERAVELTAIYCLEVGLYKTATDYQAAIQLLEPPGGGLAYSASEPIDGDGGNLGDAAATLGDKARTFLEVIEDRFFHDPDIRPWFSPRHHDIRAIRDFLLAMAYTYRNEVGSEEALTAAMGFDPQFVAPRVFRTPSLLAENDPQAVAEHRGSLEQLYPGASAFEKPMIQWAIALIDNDPTEQIKQLRIALGQARDNSPIEYVLGFTLANAGDLDRGWRHIEPLLKQNWHFPGLYSTAAEIAVLRGNIDDIREALDLALNVEPVDPEVLAIRVLLALYDEDAESEGRFREWRERRWGELTAKHLYKFNVPHVAKALADRAEGEKRREVATRLRELAY